MESTSACDCGGEHRDRRSFLRLGGAAAGLAVAGPGLLAACATADKTMAAPSTGTAPRGTQAPTVARPNDPEAALKALRDGNERFMADTPLHPNQGSELRQQLAKGQEPFAAVLCCADSRTDPSLMFDAGIGDLFVVRNAGNIASDVAAASLAYAVGVLGADLLIVLGHEACGAVKTAIGANKGELDPGEFRVLTDPIQPAVRTATATGATGNALLEASIRENVKVQTVALGERSPILRKALKDGSLKVVGAYYDLASGRAALL